MWINTYKPKISDWYVVQIDDKRIILNYNKPNGFWYDLTGKTYSPDDIECWLDDSQVKKEIRKRTINK